MQTKKILKIKKRERLSEIFSGDKSKNYLGQKIQTSDIETMSEEEIEDSIVGIKQD